MAWLHVMVRSHMQAVMGDLLADVPWGLGANVQIRFSHENPACRRAIVTSWTSRSRR